MFERLKRLFLEGRLNEEMLSNAVNKGWISEEQKIEIIQSKIEKSKKLTDNEVLEALI